MKVSLSIAVTFSLMLALFAKISTSEYLTPPYFNAAENKRIVATATCGDEGREQFCQLDMNDIFKENSCDHYCDPRPRFCSTSAAGNAIDGTIRFWQSPPLSRDPKYSVVNLSLDLGQEMTVGYVFVDMGNSPRPAVWALEKSADFGITWSPWRYFAPSVDLCEKYFGTREVNVTQDDTVNCDTGYSDPIPTDNGEIIVSLLRDRLSEQNFFESEVIQNFTKARNVRLRLLKTVVNILEEESVFTHNPLIKVLHKYSYYSIKHLAIGARCHCNGHADLCDINDPHDPDKLLCRCMHNTCGANCEICCPGFFRVGNNITDRCAECYCNEEGRTWDGDYCDELTGDCRCREGYSGVRCHIGPGGVVIDVPAVDPRDKSKRLFLLPSHSPEFRRWYINMMIKDRVPLYPRRRCSNSTVENEGLGYTV